MKFFNAIMNTENGKTYGFFPDIIGLKFEGMSFEEAYSNGISELNKFLNEFEDPGIFQSKSSKESLRSTHWTSDIVPIPFQEVALKAKIKRIKIVTVGGGVEFVGFFRRDLEKPNWHYYELEDGNIYHFRKEHMVAVLEENI